MVSIKIEPPLDQQVKRLLDAQAQQIRRSMRSAADTASDNILERGRADISAAGKFGPRWTSGLTAPVTEEQAGIVITVQESAPFWQVFQYGAVIKGKPLLYFAPDRPIFYRGKTTMPAVISVHSVTIPKKFHLVEIIQDVAKLLGALYRTSMSTGR
jgi:hypothetical protein